MKVIVTTAPFGEKNNLPRKLLEEKDIQVSYNEINRKYNREELLEVLNKETPDIIIAGTEKYDKESLNLVNNLKLISRVGIGLDSVDLDECKKRNILVTYTPDAPSNAVAELTVAQMINMFRRIPRIEMGIRYHNWKRYIGREIKNSTIGIIGVGRIGNLVIRKLQKFDPKNIYINDINEEKTNRNDLVKKSKTYILENSDIITIHIPLNNHNYNYITKNELNLMKKNSCIINMSRGGIINEKDLYEWLKVNKEASAAIDVYENEPYTGSLLELDNAYLTPHLGSCTEISRYDMEVGAVEEVLNYLNNKKFNNRVV